MIFEGVNESNSRADLPYYVHLSKYLTLPTLPYFRVDA